MKKFKKSAAIVALLATLLVASLAVASSASAAGTITGSGSVAMEPYIRALIKGYKKVDPSVTINYTANGGNAGVKDVQQGRSNFAGQARPPVPADGGTLYSQAFKDGMCIVANPKNKLKNITLQQVADIYTAKITSWSGIPGSGRTDTIAPFGRESNAGQYTFFLQAVLNNAKQATNVTTVLSDGLVRSGVQTNPAGIGYIGQAYITKKIKSLKLNGVPCEKKYVKNNKYPLSRYLFFVTPAAGASPDAAKFIKWARTSEAAGVLIDKVGGVTVYNKKPKAKKKVQKSSAAEFISAITG